MARVAAADRSVKRWGDVRTVLVTARDVDAGVRLGTDDLTTRALPVALIPASALSRKETVIGRVGRIGLTRGQAIVPGQLSAPRQSAGSTRIGANRRGIAVPTGATRPALAPGDRVDLIAASRPGDVGADAASRVVADNVEVVDVHEQSVTIAVEEANVTQVAAAIVSSTVVVALRGS